MADQENFPAGHQAERQTSEEARAEAPQTGAVSDAIRDVRGFLGVPKNYYVRGVSLPEETSIEGEGDDFVEPRPVDPEAIPPEVTWLRPELNPISWLRD